ncbi:uncharacterized protein TNCV_4169671 [Trichonephila clavipes]|nr:uncharacterized protein TNCV_4169671 [Trichonephila clavipes]
MADNDRYIVLQVKRDQNQALENIASQLLTATREPGLSLLFTHSTFKDTLDLPYHSRIPDLIRRHSHDLRLVTRDSSLSCFRLLRSFKASLVLPLSLGRGSRVVWVSDRGWLCHEFEPSTIKDSACRAVMLNLSRAETSSRRAGLASLAEKPVFETTGGCCSPVVKQQENGTWRRRSNLELYQSHKESDIVNFIKIQRIKWEGHVVRMDEDRITKKFFSAQPIGTRRKGRPYLRWIVGLEKDLLVLRTKNWRTLA